MKIKNNKNNARTQNYGGELALRQFSHMSSEAVLQQVESYRRGLTHEEAENRLLDHGANTIKRKNQHSTLSRVVEALINPFNIILLIIATVTFVTDVVIAEKWFF